MREKKWHRYIAVSKANARKRLTLAAARPSISGLGLVAWHKHCISRAGTRPSDYRHTETAMIFFTKPRFDCSKCVACMAPLPPGYAARESDLISSDDPPTRLVGAGRRGNHSRLTVAVEEKDVNGCVRYRCKNKAREALVDDLPVPRHARAPLRRIVARSCREHLATQNGAQE